MNSASASRPNGLAVAPLSALSESPADFVRAAHIAGFASVGLRVFPVSASDRPFPIDIGSRAFRGVRNALDDTGVRVTDIEVLSVTPELSREDWLPGMEAGAALGAELVNVVGDDPSKARFADTVARIAQDARDHGLLPVLEPIAYRAFDSYRVAFDIAAEAECAVELDMLHFVRTGTAVATIAAHADLVRIVQLCDAPASAADHGDALRGLAADDTEAALQVAESRLLRLLPGDGVAPIAELLRVLGPDTPISVEIPNAGLRGERSAAEYLALLGAAASDFLAGVGRGGVRTDA